MIVAEGCSIRTPRQGFRQLQWGRNLIVAEGQSLSKTPRRPARASMGPQLDSCGRLMAVDAGVAIAEALQWGRNLIVAEGCATKNLDLGRRTSMGPQLDSCGRHRPQSGSCCALPLQWGRNLIVAEGEGPGPVQEAGPGTSMGPQLDSCGRTTGVNDVSTRPVLQWGRNLIVAEGSSGFDCKQLDG